jgi:NUMOD3 motif
VPGGKRPPDGHVSTALIAGKLGIDRRVLKQLHKLGEVAGVREGGVLWLERRSLAAYLWSRPRCVRDDCGRRVIGDGPGCHLHRRSGRQHTEETRRKMSEAKGGQGVVVKTCAQCGGRFMGRGERFCTKSCATTAANAQRGSGLLRRLQDGHTGYRDQVQRVKAERGLLDIDELRKRLSRAGVPRSPGAITGYVRDGLLEPERDLGFDKPQLFTEAAVDELVSRLRSDDHDRRGLRFDKQPFRGDWHKARHRSTKGYGLLNGPTGAHNIELAAAKGKKVGRPDELDAEAAARIRDMAARGKSQRTIAQTIGISRGQVRRALSP